MQHSSYQKRVPRDQKHHRSLAGLNLNPKKGGNQFQRNDIETILERICKKTYLRESGWEIVRKQGLSSYDRPAISTCKYEKGKKKN